MQLTYLAAIRAVRESMPYSTLLEARDIVRKFLDEHVSYPPTVRSINEAIFSEWLLNHYGVMLKTQTIQTRELSLIAELIDHYNAKYRDNLLLSRKI